ncbi:MAG TPA: tetratricopeptide repeat protein [Chthoniobacterales bacterium]|nr:tetratricopeptide repeat protein [Chthoniobacterales bacterium]
MIPRFHRAKRALCLLAVVLATGLATSSCNRGPSPEEKALRAELRQALRERSYARAATLAHQLVGSSPHDNGAWETLARAQLGQGQIAEAKQTMGEWFANVRTPPPKFHELAGDLAKKENDQGAALLAWSRALAANPKNVRLLNKIARAHRAQEQWQEEDAMLTLMLEIKEDAATRMARALCRRRQHRWSDAVEDFRRAQDLDAGDPDVRRGARLFERLGKFLAEVRKLDARLATRPEDDQLLADRALLFLRSEDAELALQDGAAAGKLASWTVRPKLFQAIALVDLGRAAECEKLGVDPRLRLGALSPEFLETISRLDAEISVERNNANLYVTRAWHLNEIGQPTLAAADAETALQHEPKSGSAHTESSYALMKLGRVDEAFEHIRQATDLGGNESTAWHYRGELEMVRGDHAAAIESLTRALALEQSPAILQKRAECYQHVGLVAKADEDRRAYQDMTARGLN